ncbi:hypothetical protein [Streptomyces sp. 8N706]|uniref:hypothetical protein n=1 Tax=Streptomyces sp. 8N706 TaxID=3457416 RepID=UPI003FD08EFD
MERYQLEQQARDQAVQLLAERVKGIEGRPIAAAKVSTDTAASDPHGDRAAATAALAAHEADTTSVHGIADTSVLETASGAHAEADAAQSAATSAAATDATTKANAAQSAAIADAATTYLSKAGGTLTGAVTVNRANSTDIAVAGLVGAQAFDAFRLYTDGKMEFGPETGARDTTLFAAPPAPCARIRASTSASTCG